MTEFRKACRALGVDAVPYQARHSGASEDRARGRRRQDEVQKRGRWSSIRSVMRYEKGGLLQQSALQLSSELRVYLQACEARLGEIILGTTADIPVPPPI